MSNSFAKTKRKKTQCTSLFASIKKVARNGDFVTTISLFLTGQGAGFFGIPWTWSRGSILTGIFASVVKCFFYTYMGITLFEASESCVGLIAGHDKDELPELSSVVDFKFGKNWSYSRDALQWTLFDTGFLKIVHSIAFFWILSVFRREMYFFCNFGNFRKFRFFCSFS